MSRIGARPRVCRDSFLRFFFGYSLFSLFRYMALVWVLMLFLTSCSIPGITSGPTPLPTAPPTVAEIRMHIADAIRASESIHFVLDFSGETVFADPNQTFALINVEGDLKRPDGALAIFTIRTVAAIAEIRLVSLMGQQYVTNPVTREWQCLPPGAVFDPVVLLDSTQGVEYLLLEAFENETLVGVEDLPGRSLYHIRGSIQADALQKMTYDMLGAGTVEIDLWADTDTFQVMQMVLVDTGTDPDDPSTWTLSFSDYNKAVDVRAPIECS